MDCPTTTAKNVNRNGSINRGYKRKKRHSHSNLFHLAAHKRWRSRGTGGGIQLRLLICSEFKSEHIKVLLHMRDFGGFGRQRLRSHGSIAVPPERQSSRG